MRRFELVDGTSSKFWEIDLNGSEYTVRFGRIGTNGQTQVKTYSSDVKAEIEYDKVIGEKVRKGYTELEGDDSTIAPRASAVVEPSLKPNNPATNETVAESMVDDARPSLPVGVLASAESVSSPPAEMPDYSIDEDRIFWDDSLAKRAWAVRGATLKCGRPVRSSEAIITAIRTQMSANSWMERLVTPYLEADARNRETALPLLTWDFGMELVAARGGVDFALDVVHNVLARPTGNPRYPYANPFSFQAIDELRNQVAGLPDAIYPTVARMAQEMSVDGPVPRFFMAFVFPTEPWAKAIADADYVNSAPLLACLDAFPSGPLQLSAHDLFGGGGNGGTLAASLLHRFGFDAVPLLLGAKGDWSMLNKERLTVLSRIGDDRVFAELLEDLGDRATQVAVGDASVRQPHRAIRLLSGVKGKHADPAKFRLAAVIEANPGAVDRLRSALSPSQLAVIASIESRRARKSAPDSAVPAFLASPPWKGPKNRTAREVVPGAMVLRTLCVIDWTDAELSAAASARMWDSFQSFDRIDEQIRQVEHMIVEAKNNRRIFAAGYTTDFVAHQESHLAELRAMQAKYPRGSIDVAIEHVQTNEAIDLCAVLRVPPELVELALSRTAKAQLYVPDQSWARVVARYGAATENFIASAVRQSPKLLGLVPMVGSTLLAPHAARLARSKAGRRIGYDWLQRFPEHAASGLIGNAIGKLGKDRDDAEAALRWLDRSGHGDVVRSVAATGGSDVAAAVESVLSLDPLSLYPTKIPGAPSWLTLSSLEPVMLRDGSGTLPETALANLITMLSFSTLDEPYAGIEIVKETCTVDSLGRFAWSLFQAWFASGYPSVAGWALTQLGLIGDDDVARKLAALIRVWPGEGGHARATTGLSVLAAIGSDVSLMHLNGIAERVKFKGLKDNAKAKIEEIAEVRGLSKEELADRLVPDLGLDDEGSLWLDFGPRRFRVGFDELLSPFVRDETGAKLRALPKSNSKDDAEKAKAASEVWKALKKDATDASKVQVRRIEAAMCAQRRWTPDVFRMVFVDHPLMGHVARRLAWGVYNESGTLTGTFRIAEDRSLADENDDTFELDESAIIGIPHLLEIGEELAGTWGGVFADYEVLQPFPQLGRELYPITEAERTAVELDRLKGQECHYGKILGLEYRGWRKGDAMDGGVVGDMTKELPSGLFASLQLEEGLYLGMMSDSPPQKILSVSVKRRPDSWNDDARVPFGQLSPIEFSELVRDLESIRN